MKTQDADDTPKKPNWVDHVLEGMIVLWLSAAVIGGLVGALMES